MIAIVLAGLIAAALLMTTASPAAAGTEPGWWTYDRPAEFELVREQVHVPMRDGARLGCYLYRPGRGGAVAPGRFPSIVHDYTPYYGPNGSTDGRSGSADPRTEYLAMRGYNVIRCAVRGTGQSDGDYSTWFREIELEDNYELIEWLAAQPWSTERIGQSGFSYGGITSYRVAARQPPHLVAIAPHQAASNIYDEMIYPGGMFSEYYASVWSALVTQGTSPPTDGLDVYNSFRSHPLFDEYWDQIAYNDDYGKIKVPVLGFGGWQDIFQWGMIRSYEGMASNGDPQRKGPWLIVGPWQHTYADQAPVQPVPAGVLLAWWDHWLQQRPGAPLPSAAVTSFEQPLVGGRGWEELAAWPPLDSVTQRFHFGVDSGLATPPGLEGERSYDVKPDGPSRHTLAGPRTEEPEADQASSDGRRVTYTTPPLVDDVVVAGDPEVRLKAKLSEAEGAFIVKLEDVYPDGRVIEATTGHLKASHRLGHERGVAITPNEVTEYVIPIKPTHWRFAKGHSIRVAVTSSDLPITDQQTEGGTVTLLSGPDGSFIDLPIRTNAGPTRSEQALACTTRRLVMADVIPGRRRVRLVGYADRRYVGRTVSIVFGRQGRRVARARVRRDGSFRTSAPLPPLSLRATSAARYQARLGGERSQRLKLMRRMRVTRVGVADGLVTIAGRIRGPLTRPPARVEVRRRVSCGRWERVTWIRPDRRGRFRTTLAGPPERLAATYRFGTRVRVSGSRRVVRTFTLPVHISFG